MRIAYALINANRREGTSRAVLEVAERLAARHDVSILARSADDLDTTKVTWHQIRCPAWPDIAEFAIFKRRATRLLRSMSVDIVHSAGCNVPGADVYTIQTVHPKKVEATGGPSRNRGVSPLRRVTRDLYDRWVTAAERECYTCGGDSGVPGYLPVSSGTARELLECYSVSKSPTEIIPNGADLEVFHPGLRDLHRRDVLSALGISEDRTVVLFAGGEWLRKGLRLAIEGLALASSPNTCLLVAGDDPERDSYQQLVRDRHLEDRVHFLGFRDDIPRIYGVADVFLFPTHYEAFSLATIEAAAAGIPVLMPDVSGAEELVGDGTCGEVIPHEPSGIAAAIDRLAGDADYRRRLSRAARQRVEQQFNWDVVADRTEQFYHRILGGRRDVNGKRSQRKQLQPSP